MLRFISFGSGSCGNCYYLDDGTNGLLIDIGVGIRALKKQFGDYGLRFVNGFDAILVTHDHADHIKSVGSLCKKFDVPVYASRLVHEGMDKNYCMKCKIAQSHRKKIEYGEEFSIGNFNIRPFQVPHDSSDNVGYMIENGGIVFSLLTDVGRITDDMKSVIQQSDYLVIEANYDAQMLAVSLPRVFEAKNTMWHGTSEQRPMRTSLGGELLKPAETCVALPPERGEQQA